jgi:hypothetical protein
LKKELALIQPREMGFRRGMGNPEESLDRRSDPAWVACEVLE